MAITATFGTAEYLNDDLIKIPITVDACCSSIGSKRLQDIRRCAY